MKVAIASDHAGYHLKQAVKEHLLSRGIDTVDLGPFVPERCDYPDFAQKVCKSIQKSEVDWGVLVCGTGIGMSMTANRFKGIRAAVVTDSFCAAATRQHNDANVLCLGERVLGIGIMKGIVDAWCEASFEGGRHENRLRKMQAMEGINL